MPLLREIVFVLARYRTGCKGGALPVPHVGCKQEVTSLVREIVPIQVTLRTNASANQ